ncbi:MAG: DUF4190 domain-containing protein [Clostridiales bacterium]|nr:DUF4190 domain-containing protein [Clostridiales bacterium]
MDENKEMNSNSGLDKETFGDISYNRVEEMRMRDAGELEEVKKTDVDEVEEKKVYFPENDKAEPLSNSQMNYYTGTPLREQTKKEGKALEICALVFGILGVVCCCCYGVFGIVGLVLSIIALATGKKNGLSIAALICSIIGLLATFALIAYSLTDAGKEASKDFVEKYGMTSESVYGNTEELEPDVYDTEEFTEVTNREDGDTEETFTIVNEGALKNTELSDAEAGKMIICGETITVPCKVAEIEQVFEIAEENQVTSMEVNDSTMCYLNYNGQEIPVEIYAINESGEKINGMESADVKSVTVSVDESSMVDVEVLDGIKVGMSKNDLEQKLAEYEYTKSEYPDEDCTMYGLNIGSSKNVKLTIMVNAGIVGYIDILVF